MQLDLDEAVIQSTGLTANELRLELAVQLYASSKLTKAQARRLTDLDRLAFTSELTRRGLGEEYTEKMFTEDLKALGIR
ncbi:UPF0175 family protein [Fibrisoma montanum]|uniref:UPF0175 family protein n=1 Tax=Fibrisoma montanum TaxID=2305895 RepID=A0A418MFP9_9BACT|nr:UPF0175 family protein [Fibrisoma montanum]RIV25585.1 UPF0175 family protein [Fibrisoma montanum]